MSEDQKIETLADEVRELNRLRNIAAKAQAEVMKQHNKIMSLIPSALAECNPDYDLIPKGVKSARVFAVFNGHPLTQEHVVAAIGDMSSDEVYGALRNCERRGFISADRSVTPYLYHKIKVQ